MKKKSQIREEVIEKRARREALYIIEKRCTLRDAAKEFGVGKSTIHLDVTKRLKEFCPLLASKVEDVIKENKEERHIRGGLATKRRYNK